jgi:4-hydroxy-3-polyprenylbenzoate decarboxylase
VKKHKIVVGVTGASGAIYAKVLLEKLTLLQDQLLEVAVVFSDNARDVWEYELGHKDYSRLPFKVYDKGDFMAPFASGSARFETMIICPCSMGTMARIAHGISGDLITQGCRCHLKGEA